MLELRCLHKNISGFATYYPWDFKQVIKPLCASAYPSAKWDSNSNYSKGYDDIKELNL